jgi:hypothetical protein
MVVCFKIFTWSYTDGCSSGNGSGIERRHESRSLLVPAKRCL